MRNFLILLILFNSVLLFSQENDTILKLFRSVNINNGRKISLQSSIDKYVDVTRKLGNNYYSIKKGNFSNADSIAVEVNDAKQIIGIICVYNYAPEFSNDTAYIHEQRKYRSLISKGTEFTYNANKESIRVTKWSYKTTSFELLEVNSGHKKEIYSVIFDQNLNYEKYKNSIDLNKNDISLELFKRIGLK